MKETDSTRKSSRLQNSRQGKHVNNVTGSDMKKYTKRKRSEIGSDNEGEKINRKVNRIQSKYKIIDENYLVNNRNSTAKNFLKRDRKHVIRVKLKFLRNSKSCCLFLLIFLCNTVLTILIMQCHQFSF